MIGADALGSEPMRLGRDERRELVDYLAGESMSTRAIEPIVGVDRKTFERDIRGGTNAALYARLTRRTVRTLRRYSDGRNARRVSGWSR